MLPQGTATHSEESLFTYKGKERVLESFISVSKVIQKPESPNRRKTMCKLTQEEARLQYIEKNLLASPITPPLIQACLSRPHLYNTNNNTGIISQDSNKFKRRINLNISATANKREITNKEIPKSTGKLHTRDSISPPSLQQTPFKSGGLSQRAIIRCYSPVFLKYAQ